jgi:hypothetical protein
MRSHGKTKPSRLPSENPDIADDVAGLLERLNVRLKAGLVDTKCPAFYAVMAYIIRFQLNWFCDEVEHQTINMESREF